MTASTQRAADALMTVWRDLRDDASPGQLACAGRIALFADEAGRTWCAYCGDMMNGGPR